MEILGNIVAIYLGLICIIAITILIIDLMIMVIKDIKEEIKK